MKKDQLIALGERAEEYIRERLSEKLDRDTICRALSTNRTTLSSALILRTGRTLKRFILDERIRLGKKLLLSGEQSIDAIAEKCGFSDAAYFSRVFRECTGMTPAAYSSGARAHGDTHWRYTLDKETLPQLPCVHDCAIARIEMQDGYLSLYFDEDLSQYDVMAHIYPDASSLVVRYHLCDPYVMFYRSFRRKKSDGQGVEIGYALYEDQDAFLEESADMKLYYLHHFVAYNAVVLKLWSYDDPHEVVLEFNADTVEYEWGFEEKERRMIERMKGAGIKFEAGMSKEELLAAERRFGFTFPREIAAFLRCGVPADERFFNYRDLSDENVEKFKCFCKIVEEGFAFDIVNVPCFFQMMEGRYGTQGVEKTLEAIMSEYEQSPKLIPFFSHRCFFDGLDDMPIVSYSQPCDVVIYGENFEEYLKKEFCGEKVFYPVHIPLRTKEIGIWAVCIREEPHVAAHDHCTRNRMELARSQKCGCFYCLRTFAPEEIERWIDEGKTALCPFCQIDSVVGDASGYSVTEGFLKTMNAYWFSLVSELK